MATLVAGVLYWFVPSSTSEDRDEAWPEVVEVVGIATSRRVLLAVLACDWASRVEERLGRVVSVSVYVSLSVCLYGSDVNTRFCWFSRHDYQSNPVCLPAWIHS